VPLRKQRDAIDGSERLTGAARWLIDRMPDLLAGDADTVACARDLLAPLANDAVMAAIVASPPDWPGAIDELIVMAKDTLVQHIRRTGKARRRI